MKDKVEFVDSRDVGEMIRVLKVLCSATRSFCYTPLNISEVATSLSWAETLQHLPEGCAEDEVCAVKVLDMFGTILKIALEGNYVFTIDVEKVREALAKILAQTPAQPYSGQHTASKVF